jgi:hypothetical protein
LRIGRPRGRARGGGRRGRASLANVDGIPSFRDLDHDEIQEVVVVLVLVVVWCGEKDVLD